MKGNWEQGIAMTRKRGGFNAGVRIDAALILTDSFFPTACLVLR